MENIMMLEKSAMYLKPKYIERIPKELKKMHGSKVKLGVFCGCRITMFGTESVILVDKDHLVPLTPSYIKACYQLYEKFKHEQMKKYYYYKVIFQDGSWSNLRVSEKHLENLKSMEVSEELLDDETVMVVYDGKAPCEAARKLEQYITSEIGYPVKFLKADDYEKLDEIYTTSPASKVIIVGHHSLAKNTLHWLGNEYNKYGMRYGFDNEMCVLRASESAVKNEKGAYYNYYADCMKNSLYKELAKQYKIPDKVGDDIYDKIRKSQYDLLLLEFIVHGLPVFLELQGTKVLIKSDKQQIYNELCQKLRGSSCRKYINSSVLLKICEERKLYKLKVKFTSNNNEDWQEIYKTELDGWIVQRYKDENYCRILDEKGDIQGQGKIRQVICPILDYCNREEKLEKLHKRDWGIVFCGGGARGAYQIGVWKWLKEHGFVEKITGVSGVSVGALNSLLFVCEDYETAYAVWRDIKTSDIAYKKEGVPFSQKRLKSIINRNVKRWEDIYGSEKIVYSAVTSKNVPIPLRAYIEYCRKKVATTRSSIEPEYLCWAAREKEDIQEMILSSAAIPVFFKSHDFEGKNFVDGGLVDNYPARPLVEDGFRNIIVVHLSRNWTKINFQKNLRDLDTSGVKFYHVEPKSSLGSIWKANLELTEKRINDGYNDAKEQLSELLQKIID